MNHKRHKPRVSRGGCKMCKPYKWSSKGDQKSRQERKAATAAEFDDGEPVQR